MCPRELTVHTTPRLLRRAVPPRPQHRPAQVPQPQLRGELRARRDDPHRLPPAEGAVHAADVRELNRRRLVVPGVERVSCSGVPRVQRAAGDALAPDKGGERGTHPRAHDAAALARGVHRDGHVEHAAIRQLQPRVTPPRAAAGDPERPQPVHSRAVKHLLGLLAIPSLVPPAPERDAQRIRHPVNFRRGVHLPLQGVHAPLPGGDHPLRKHDGQGGSPEQVVR
mmetsp:Transcript_16559/g.40531  ORF Transcript_16559/g.40531 Transcript_16559/m.40531 type:complete len:224 (-) Transcript_16559:339-1010(-)